MRDFITRIQESDEQVRRRWFYVLSGISIVLVVFVWVLDVSPSFTEEPATAEEVSETSLSSELGSFTASVRDAFSDMKSMTGSFFTGIRESFETPRELDIRTE